MKLRIFLAFGLVSCAWPLSAFEFDRRIHDELESSGGHALGLGQGGMAAVSDVSSVKTNPAMLGLEKGYSVYGSYHWPTFGRQFYQAGVVDTKTSTVAAGLLFTGFEDEFDLLNFDEQDGKDSIINNRLGVALGQVIGRLSFGLSVFFTNGYVVDESTVAEPEEKKVTTFGLGVAGHLTPQLRFGVSAENLGNRKMPEFAPRFLRAGLALLLYKGTTSLHVDYVNRQRIRGSEYDVMLPQQWTADGSLSVTAADEQLQEDKKFMKNEQMLVGSFSVKVYDLIRVLGSYGADMVSDRQSVAGGIALVNQQYSLSYSSSRPYLSSPSTHQSINLGMQISL